MEVEPFMPSDSPPYTAVALGSACSTDAFLSEVGK
jgi:hypothetical protein